MYCRNWTACYQSTSWRCMPARRPGLSKSSLDYATLPEQPGVQVDWLFWSVPQHVHLFQDNFNHCTAYWGKLCDLGSVITTVIFLIPKPVLEISATRCIVVYVQHCQFWLAVMLRADCGGTGSQSQIWSRETAHWEAEGTTSRAIWPHSTPAVEKGTGTFLGSRTLNQQALKTIFKWTIIVCSMWGMRGNTCSQR